MAKKRNTLITVLSILLITGFLITSLASYYVSRASLRSQIIRNDLPLTSDTIYSEIQRDLLRPIFISSLMSTDTFMRDWVIHGENDPEKIIRYLNEIKNKYQTVSSFFVSDKTFNYYYPEGILKKISPDEKRDAWYFRVRNMKNDYEINVDPDMANKDTMTIFINYRVYDYKKNYIGATGVGLAVSSVKKLIANYQKKYNRNIYFTDADGLITLSGMKNSTGDMSISHMPEMKNVLKTLSSKKEHSFRLERNGKTVHLQTRFIPEFNWFLFVEQPESYILKHVLTTLFINLGICGLVTAVVLYLTGYTIKAYQKRIETLRGIVPICSFCKQIRDDKGYWNQVEAYVSKYTDAQFSHGVCPKCREEHYPELP